MLIVKSPQWKLSFEYNVGLEGCWYISIIEALCVRFHFRLPSDSNRVGARVGVIAALISLHEVSSLRYPNYTSFDPSDWMLIHRSCCSLCTVKRLLIVNSIFNLVTVTVFVLTDCIEMLLRMLSSRYLIVVRSISICAAPLLFPMNFFFLFQVNSTRALSRVYVHEANILFHSRSQMEQQSMISCSIVMLKVNNSFDTIIFNNFLHLYPYRPYYSYTILLLRYLIAPKSIKHAPFNSISILIPVVVVQIREVPPWCAHQRLIAIFRMLFISMHICTGYAEPIWSQPRSLLNSARRSWWRSIWLKERIEISLPLWFLII